MEESRIKFCVDLSRMPWDLKNPANRIEFQRVQRNGKVKREKPRPIIVRFLRFSDRESVL